FQGGPRETGLKNIFKKEEQPIDLESTPGVMVVKSMRNRGEDPATPLCLQERESNVQGLRQRFTMMGPHRRTGQGR
ncbi:hypothetical protein, partial [Intestinimonas butyriciproducens]|uniref:hypothetical protein n=1 Tax=Intestinimonas butyriciproducens TaxID=1297617 RepID=UPI0034A35E99